MKNRIFLPMVFSLLFTFILTSCVDDWEDPFGDPVEKFLGNWKVTEQSTLFGGQYNYDVSISRNPQNHAEILISNFYMQGPGELARALVYGNAITIMQQTICNGTITIKGSGQFNAGVITLVYTANDGADIDNVSANYRRP